VYIVVTLYYSDGRESHIVTKKFEVKQSESDVNIRNDYITDFSQTLSVSEVRGTQFDYICDIHSEFLRLFTESTQWLCNDAERALFSRSNGNGVYNTYASYTKYNQPMQK